MAIILMKNWMALFHLSCFSLAGSVCVFCDRALSLNHLHLVHRYTSDRANRTTNSGVSLRLACENYPSQFILSAELSLSKSAWNVTRGEYANREWEENEIERKKYLWIERGGLKIDLFQFLCRLRSDNDLPKQDEVQFATWKKYCTNSMPKEIYSLSAPTRFISFSPVRNVHGLRFIHSITDYRVTDCSRFYDWKWRKIVYVDW